MAAHNDFFPGVPIPEGSVSVGYGIRRLSEHVHGCLKCRPDMVPDFDPADERYHDGSKCGAGFQVLVNGVELRYTSRSFEGHEGWTLFVGPTIEDVHHCPCTDVFENEFSHCCEPRFGYVQVIHGCPAEATARWRRMIAELRAGKVRL